MFVLLLLYSSVKMHRVYMFEMSTASATGVQRLFNGGVYLIFGLTGAAFIWGGGGAVLNRVNTVC